MTTHKKVSVLPIYLVGFVWLGYALLFPLNAPSSLTRSTRPLGPQKRRPRSPSPRNRRTPR